MPLDAALAALRKELHERPEPAFQETATRDIVERFVTSVAGGRKSFRISRCLETGLVIEYRGGGAKEPFVLFRADMDALPLTEEPSHPVVSRRPGFMHACGHDIHMTVLAGLIAKVARERPRRNLLFVFQPGEEGAGGAKRMMDEGAFNGYVISAAYALHVTDDHLLGEAATRAGVLFAMPREVDIIFTGIAGHAAFPQKGSDALFAAAHFVSTLPGMLARRLDPMRRFLCHFGKVEGGTARNIIADRCVLQGTLRALDRETMDAGVATLEEAARSSSALVGVSCRIETLGEFLPVVCDAALALRFREACAASGTRFVESPVKLVGEDFGFFCARWPSLLFWLGTRREEEPPRELHTAAFYPPDEAVERGIALFSALLEGAGE